MLVYLEDHILSLAELKRTKHRSSTKSIADLSKLPLLPSPSWLNCSCRKDALISFVFYQHIGPAAGPVKGV